jgi:hypothetical protein
VPTATIRFRGRPNGWASGLCLIERTARDDAYGCIHAGGVTATRKDRDLLHKPEAMTTRDQAVHRA